MANDYIPRRSSSAQRYRSVNGSSPQRNEYPQRRPPQRRRRGRNGPPPFLLIALALIVIIAAVLLVVVFAGRGKDPEPTSSPSSSLSQTSGAPVSQASGLDPTSGTSSLSSSEPAPTSATPPPEKIPSGAMEERKTFLQIGDTGFEYYNFVEEYANQYITTVSRIGQELEGSATVYDMIIPTSMDITLPDSYLDEHNINSQDQNKAINYMYSSINAMNPSVKTVPIFDALKAHNTEYVYFRTDHHWTQLGAYYAYAEFCKAKGMEAVALDQFEKKSYSGFLGSFYRDEPTDAMLNNPDTVEAYVSNADTTMHYTTEDGETFEQAVIADGTDYDSQWLYLIFCAGDQPYEEITNSGITDGSSCVVVKESFGNAFIPYLVNHYQTIYVVDYRYYAGNIATLAKEKGAKDVILINNISMTRNEDLVNSLDNSF